MSGHGMGNCPEVILGVSNPQITTRNGQGDPWLGQLFGGSTEGGVIVMATINHNMLIHDKGWRDGCCMKFGRLWWDFNSDQGQLDVLPESPIFLLLSEKSNGGF